MKTFTILLSDLNNEAKEEFLKFEGVENESEMNCETIPIATICREEINE